jgi:hypothetical protein
MDSFLGLPLHPLVVHFAVVLVPLCSLAILACAFPKVRARIGLVVAAFALITLFVVGLAEKSGKELEHEVDESTLVEDHAAMGDSLLPIQAIATISFVALLVLERAATGERDESSEDASPHSVGTPIVAVLSAFMVLGSLGAAVRVVQIGHSGARATWEDVELGGSD